LDRSFDTVRFMRERRAEIDEEDAALSWEEKRRKTESLLAGDTLWQRLQGRRVEAHSRVFPHASTTKR